MTHGQCCIPSNPTPRVAGTAPLTAAIGQALISCHPGHRHQPSSCSRPVGRPVSYRRSSRQDEVTLRADPAVEAEGDLGATGGAYFQSGPTPSKDRSVFDDVRVPRDAALHFCGRLTSLQP
jgi:hypothetical protein